MKSRISLIIASLLVALSFASTATAKKAVKVDICHFDKDAGLFHVINISDNAESMHRTRHGDVDLGTYFEDADGDNVGAGPSVDSCPNVGLVSSSGDNCPDVANEDQADLDSDGIGDPCDDDGDGDGIVNGLDACPDEFPLGNDANGDGCTDVDIVACPCGSAEEVKEYFNPLIDGTVYRTDLSGFLDGGGVRFDRDGVGYPGQNVTRFFTQETSITTSCAMLVGNPVPAGAPPPSYTQSGLSKEQFNACKREIKALDEILGTPDCPPGANGSNRSCMP